MIIIGFLLGFFIFWYFSQKKNKSVLSDTAVTSAIEVDQSLPDPPTGFGYKCMWFAIKTNDSQKVADLFELKNIVPCNWRVGVQKAYGGSAFVTPPIDGWTLVCSTGFPSGSSVESIDVVKNNLVKLSSVFEEAQFFCTHRVIEHHCWMKAKAGVLERVYSFLGESGENIAIEGEATEFEKTVKLVDTFSSEAQDEAYFDREDLVWPNESFVMQIAANWSIDPSNLEERTDLEPALGLLGAI